MRTLRALAFPLLALACGAPASSAPPPTSTEEPAAEASTNEAIEASEESPPPCVAMGQPCESNAYCCYGSCRVEDGDPQLLCRP